ncbi:hypothetical protein PR048_027645 [Dryococelus australis]|uniref:Mixed-lineage leukemia-like protein n=1 Tax=Dryococelus australis TaxID=614101 RepID=A0ABQ9GH38_9NEOP|nr:hypothetical protein PR048_027645 [Dryococelus australis]
MRVIEVSMDDGMKGRGSGRSPKKKTPSTNGIVRLDSQMRKSGVARPGMEPGSLTAQPQYPPPPPQIDRVLGADEVRSEVNMQQRRNSRVGGGGIFPEKTCPPAASSGVIPMCENTGSTAPGIKSGNRVQSPPGSPDFRKWEKCRTMPLVSGSFRVSPVSPSLYAGAAPYSSQSPSSALKTSLSSLGRTPNKDAAEDQGLENPIVGPQLVRG